MTEATGKALGLFRGTFVFRGTLVIDLAPAGSGVFFHIRDGAPRPHPHRTPTAPCCNSGTPSYKYLTDHGFARKPFNLRGRAGRREALPPWAISANT